LAPSVARLCDSFVIALLAAARRSAPQRPTASSGAASRGTRPDARGTVALGGAALGGAALGGAASQAVTAPTSDSVASARVSRRRSLGVPHSAALHAAPRRVGQVAGDGVECFKVDKPLDLENLEPGTVLLEKYRVVDTIGIGGMGVVVAADHLQLHSRVAIKFLLPSLVRNEAVNKRFILEARAATKIKSRHVAKVVDVGTMKAEGLPKQGVPFMVMEYLHGRDLSEWVQAGRRFGVEEAAGFVIQAAEALAHAHRVGIIHRDVKTANLFLHEAEEADGEGMVKVLDFGISKLVDDPAELGLTKTTTVLGSGLYMSPEQMRSAKNVDHRTDIYALGVCLYEILTGTQPFTAETFSELCVKVNIEAPTPIREHRPELPEDFAAVAAKSYARDPNERYQTMAELAAALAPFADDKARPTVEKMMTLTSPDVSDAVKAITIPPAAASGSGAHDVQRGAGQRGAAAPHASAESGRPPSFLMALAFAAISLSTGVSAGMVYVEGDVILGPEFGFAAQPPAAASTAPNANPSPDGAATATAAPNGTATGVTASASSDAAPRSSTHASSPATSAGSAVPADSATTPAPPHN
jgi:serine/threonine-protein kinase